MTSITTEKMMKMRMMDTTKKKYIIKTQDSYNEKTFEIVEGSCKIDILGKYRQYSYRSKYGDSDISLLDDIITVVRKDKFNNSFEISFKGERKKFSYEADMLKGEFYTLGENYSYDSESKIFSFVYKLFDLNFSEINRISFFIKEI